VRDLLPKARVSVDHFHLVKLGNDMLTAVRRRVSWDRHNRRGRVAPSVPLGKVVSTMSEAAVTPVLSRPKLSSLQLLLPRVFETLAAGTLPYFPATMSYLLDVLPELTPFVQRATEAPLIPQLLADRETYLRDLNDAQRAAYERFNYDTVFAQLHALLTK